MGRRHPWPSQVVRPVNTARSCGCCASHTAELLRSLHNTYAAESLTAGSLEDTRDVILMLVAIRLRRLAVPEVAVVLM